MRELCDVWDFCSQDCLRVRAQEPVYLPWALAAWSALSAAALAAWNYSLPSEEKHELVKSPGAFFSVGWRSGLVAAGIPINKWWVYLIIILYQLTRAIFGSLSHNLFHHHYESYTNAPRSMEEGRRDRLLRGQALVNIFNWWSALTDILFSASQIDLAIATLVVTISADYAQVYYKIVEATESEHERKLRPQRHGKRVFEAMVVVS